MKSSHHYALIGGLLGLGGPLGSLLLRTLLSPEPALAALLDELHTGAYYYLYMTLGTTTAFGLFGFMLGRQNQDLSELSVTDGLTGLYNHRYLQEHIGQEVQRSNRYATPLSCLMLDIDDFKKANDRFGHVFGDRALAQIARLIRGAVRGTDIAGRWGGEEFFVIMPETTSAAAAPLAQRILSKVSTYPFWHDGEPVHLTLSIGLATYPNAEHGVKTKSALISAADQALYAAKRAGKNQLVVWKT